MLTVGSLFSGIGGIDLGLERTGHFRTVWFSEIDSYANRVLAKHWPNVPNLGNVKEIDYATVTRPDVLVGGYPCQPFSTAGKRLGESDPRHLWPECLRALRELRPRYALFENVRGHLSLGFAQVLSDLAALGFNAEWQIIPAASVGAPHRRDRLFIVAYPSGQFGYGLNNNAGDSQQSQTATKFGNSSGEENVAYPNSNGETERGQCADVPSQNSGWGDDGGRGRGDFGQECLGGSGEVASNVANANSQSRNVRGCSNGQGTAREWSTIQKPSSRGSGNVADDECERYGEHGQPTDVGSAREVWGHYRGREAAHDLGEWWESEPDVGRVANGIPSRVDRLRALGNAVVPQVAEMIGYMIAEHANA